MLQGAGVDELRVSRDRQFAMIQFLEKLGAKFEKDGLGDYNMHKVHHVGTYVLPMPEGHNSGGLGIGWGLADAKYAGGLVTCSGREQTVRSGAGSVENRRQILASSETEPQTRTGRKRQSAVDPSWNC